MEQPPVKGKNMMKTTWDVADHHGHQSWVPIDHNITRSHEDRWMQKDIHLWLLCMHILVPTSSLDVFWVCCSRSASSISRHCGVLISSYRTCSISFTPTLADLTVLSMLSSEDLFPTSPCPELDLTKLLSHNTGVPTEVSLMGTLKGWTEEGCKVTWDTCGERFEAADLGNKTREFLRGIAPWLSWCFAFSTRACKASICHSSCSMDSTSPTSCPTTGCSTGFSSSARVSTLIAAEYRQYQ